MAFALPPDAASWVQSEWQDYVAPKDWKGKGEKKKEGFALSKKKGTEETDTPYYKVEGLLRGVPLAKVTDVVHTRALEYAPQLDKHYQGGNIIDKLDAARLNGVADEGLVYYRQSKLPFVDNRDFVTITLVKTLENPTTKRKVVAFFSRSIEHPAAPAPPKGYTRATVLRCCAFLEETAEGTLYTFTNQADVHMKLSKAAQKGSKAYMKEAFGALKKVLGAQ